MNWICIEERYPEDDQEVLMTYNNFVVQGLFKNHTFYHPSCDCFLVLEEQEGITHWMPFPEPPEDD